MIRLSPTLFALVPLLAGLAACSDSTGLSVRTLSLSFGGSRPPASAASLGSASLLDVTSADGKLSISKVELVVREIEVGEDRDERNGDERETADDEGDRQTCEVASSDDDCEDLEIGPILVNVPLTDNSIDRQLTVDIPAGSYDKLEFKIQAPSRGNDRDAAFRAAHPTFATKSIHVVGTYGGAPFDLYLAANAEVEVEFAQPLVVSSGPANVTVRVDVLSWFANGASTIDPATVTPGSVAETLVLRNVKRSFHAFEDEDEDGDDDHGGDRD